MVAKSPKLVILALLLMASNAAQACPFFFGDFEEESLSLRRWSSVCKKEINDSGFIACATANANGLSCPQLEFPRQDAEFGRDAQGVALAQRKVGAGFAGFDFSKVSASGAVLPIDASDWSCIRDNVTGLLWERKTLSGLSREQDKYAWRNSDGYVNGGNPGGNNLASCELLAPNCNTEVWIERINQNTLCGRSDWRLPGPEELFGILALQFGSRGILDPDFFEITHSVYWTSDTSRDSAARAYIVSTLGGGVSFDLKENTAFVIAVAGPRERGRSASRFVINSGGNVVDLWTGLEWLRCEEGLVGDVCDSGAPLLLNWSEALRRAESVSHQGQNDWRLPSVKELVSLYSFKTDPEFAGGALIPTNPEFY